MNILDALIFDIKLIVCKYLHRFNQNDVIDQYNIYFKPFWNDNVEYDGQCYFDSENLCLNYRDLDEEQSSDVICTIFGNDVVAPISPNYVYTGVWQPNHITHCKMKHRRYMKAHNTVGISL